MGYVRWWHSLAIAFSIASWGLAQPLYNFIIGNDLFLAASSSAIVLFMLLYHGLPVSLLFLAERVLLRAWGNGKVLHWYRGLAFGIASLMVLRAALLEWPVPGSESWPLAVQIVLVLAVFTTLVGICRHYWKQVSLLFIYFSVASVGLTLVFVLQVNLASKIWSGSSADTSLEEPIPESQENPVILIIFDGLGGDVLFNDGGLDAAKFPNFAVLGQDSAVFTNATANYLSSEISVGSLMTGNLFSDDGQFTLGPSGAGTGGILGAMIDRGRRVEFYSNFFRCREEGIQLCHDDTFFAGKNVNMAARDFIVDFVPRSVTRAARDLVLKIFPSDVSGRIPFNPIHQFSRSLWDEFLANIDSSVSPGTVYFVHSLLPHQPYEFDRDGNTNDDNSGEAEFDDFDRMFGAYAQQVMYVDTLLGGLTNKLKIEGLYDRSLIIITADHGPRSLYLRKTYNGIDTSAEFPTDLSSAIPKVPLIIHGPGIEPQFSDVDYQHIDLMPTFLDVLGLPERPAVPGVSAFDPDRPAREKFFYGIPNNRKNGEKVSYIYDDNRGQWTRVGDTRD